MDTSDIQTHLLALVGQTIPTMTDKPNRILRVEDKTVIVGTSRSPNGAPVPIAEVQDAADRLFRMGELVVDVPTVGYRSAFIGAVLKSLPGTIVETRPRRILTGHRLTSAGNDTPRELGEDAEA